MKTATPREILGEIANTELLSAVDEAVAAGSAYWRADPYNRGVYALFTQDVPVIVLYGDDQDFEVADDALEMLKELA